MLAIYAKNRNDNLIYAEESNSAKQSRSFQPRLTHATRRRRCRTRIDTSAPASVSMFTSVSSENLPIFPRSKSERVQEMQLRAESYSLRRCFNEA